MCRIVNSLILYDLLYCNVQVGKSRKSCCSISRKITESESGLCVIHGLKQPITALDSPSQAAIGWLGATALLFSTN